MLDYSDRPRRRMVLIDLELEKINLYIATLHEVRLNGEEHRREAGSTFHWRGCPEGELRRAAVAFAIENNVTKRLSEAPKGISERIMKIADTCQS